MRVIRSAEYRRMPWRNGLGETAEIAISPAGAALDQFEWRISMATIAAPGPFSAFAGVDRTLTVLSGAGFRLVLDAQPAVELTPRSAPVSFRGESEASAQLIGGPVTDLNVMTRRDRCWHRVRRRAPGARLPFEAATAMAAVFCVTGPISVEAAGGGLELGALDTLLIDAPQGALSAGGGAGSLLLIEIGRL